MRATISGESLKIVVEPCHLEHGKQNACRIGRLEREAERLAGSMDIHRSLALVLHDVEVRLPSASLFWQLAYVPAAAQGAHQAHAGRKLPALDVDRRHLVPEESLFGGQHLEIAGDSALVARIR